LRILWVVSSRLAWWSLELLVDQYWDCSFWECLFPLPIRQWVYYYIP
jgi:hypothetical protein